MVGVIQTGWRSPVARHRSFVSLGAAMLASVSQKIRKAGLNSTNEPVIASTITTATSLVCLLGSLLFSGKTQSIKIDRQSLPFYGGAAVFALIGQLCTFIALNGGQISVVAPLINTTRYSP